MSVDGGYGTWKNVGSCSQTCGEGLQEQTRSCDNPKPQHGGAQCQGDSSQQISCNLGPCPSKISYLHTSLIKSSMGSSLLMHFDLHLNIFSTP